jgi:hypothetical protein
LTASPTHLAFVTKRAQAVWLSEHWDQTRGRRVVVCLEEALFPAEEASSVLGPEVETLGLSRLELAPGDVVQLALTLAEEFFPGAERAWPARVERWMIETLRRWLIHGVHSVLAIQAAWQRFPPSRVWLAPYPPLALTTTPDQNPDNPLFFDLLAAEARRSRIPLTGSPGNPPGQIGRRLLMPLKYVVGQWIAQLREPPSPAAAAMRPVLVSNLDNDFHRQFDLSRLGPAAGQMLAWIRAGEWLAPVDDLLARCPAPNTTRLDWLGPTASSLREIGSPAGAQPRLWAGIAYLGLSLVHRLRQRGRRRSRLSLAGVPWWDLLFGSALPSIHAECRLAGAFYCVLEYERSRSVLRRRRPRLFVAGADHWSSRPPLAAAADLGISTLATSSGISFLQDDLVERAADVVCTYGREEAERLSRRQPSQRIIEAGDVLSRWRSPRPEPPLRTRKVLLVTSARPYGWWFASLLIDAAAYAAALRACVAGLSGLQPPVRSLIKSHPLYDLYELYDRIAADRRDTVIAHRTEPMPAEEVAEFAAAVVFSTATTFTAELVRAGVPLVFFTGAMTGLGRRAVDHQGLLEAGDPETVVAHVARLMDPANPAFRQETLSRGEVFLRRYVTDGSRGFGWVLNEVLAEPASASNGPGS